MAERSLSNPSCPGCGREMVLATFIMGGKARHGHAWWYCPRCNIREDT